MSGRPAAGLVALLPPLFLMAGPRACSADDGPPKRYPSPKAVFDAYREAGARQDMRAVLPLLTRHMQDDIVFEYYQGCHIGDSKESRAVLKRFGVDWETLTSDLRREHKAKHGVEPADDEALWDVLVKEYKAEHGSAPAVWPDDLMGDILGRRIKDKAGFCEAAYNVLRDGPPRSIGDLEGVDVQGDRATGHAALRLPVAHGQEPGSKGIFDKTFLFRKVNGGWLLDSP
jgi:hypothetical protein